MSLPTSLERPASRRRCKSAPGGVGSALELERRCGLRLRQVRRAETLLGVFDVMRLADVEFGLQVSREIARQWLEACGAAVPSVVLLEVRSVEELGLDLDFCVFTMLVYPSSSTGPKNEKTKEVSL